MLPLIIGAFSWVSVGFVQTMFSKVDSHNRLALGSQVGVEVAAEEDYDNPMLQA
jgi:hypothetical protein